MVFRTCRHLIEGHCATCGLQLVLVSVTRPGSNLCMPLASVYIIGFSCFSRIEDQETSCIWSNSHSTFPSYLSWIVVSCEINQKYHDIGCRNGDNAYVQCFYIYIIYIHNICIYKYIYIQCMYINICTYISRESSCMTVRPWITLAVAGRHPHEGTFADTRFTRLPKWNSYMIVFSLQTEAFLFHDFG